MKLNRVSLWAAVAISFISFQEISAQQSQTTEANLSKKIPFNPEVKKGVLDNGLT